MKFKTQPSIYLVSRPSVDWARMAEFLEDEGLPEAPTSITAGDAQGEAIVEVSARMCYMSFGRGRKDIADFINNLLTYKDGSVFEHINYGFIFTGVSRSLTHELVRHRAGFAYSQRSQRYVDEGQASFIVPPSIASAPQEVQEDFREAVGEAQATYDDLTKALRVVIKREDFERNTERVKAIRQAARAVLPNATETKIFVTGNVRAWRHFIEMRASPFADLEIRRLAIEVLRLLRAESEMMFGDFEVSELPDGTQVATPLYSKI